MTGLSGQVATGSMIDAAKALATAISKVTINPTAVNGSASTTGTVTLAAAAPPAGALVSLSSNSTALTVSTSVTVPAGATTATFNMSTVNDSYATKTATVTASYSGGSASADVRIYPANFAQFVSQSVPTTMVAGQTYTLWFDYKNTGRTTWTAANGYRLLTMNTRANTTWGLSRIPLLGGSSVAPGATGRFMAWFYAPTTAGAYNVQVRPIEENVAEFGQLSTNLPVTVTVAADAARYISQTVPLTVAPGAAFTATITLRNVGTTTWSSAGGYTLASRAPWNNTTWGTTRVSLPTGVRVAPGASYTFTYTFTAPATAGSYNFQWQLLKSPNLFGDLSQFVVIKVK
jgi:hypothetical protein